MHYMHLNRLLQLIWVNRASVCLYRVAAIIPLLIMQGVISVCKRASLVSVPFSTINTSFQSLLTLGTIQHALTFSTVARQEINNVLTEKFIE